MGDAVGKSSPSPDNDECSEDTETTSEPTENDGSPTSEHCGTNVFDDNVPKYTDVQVDAVQKYRFDNCYCLYIL